MKSLVESLNESLVNEGLLQKIKSLFAKNKKEASKEELTEKQKVDKSGVHNLDDCGDEGIKKLADIFKETQGHKDTFTEVMDVLPWIQGLYDGAYTNDNIGISREDEFGEKRMYAFRRRLVSDPDAKKLLNDEGNDLTNAPIIALIHGYVYGFNFARFNELVSYEQKKFTLKDGEKYLKILK